MKKKLKKELKKGDILSESSHYRVKNIYSSKVFTVCFKKQDKAKSAKQFKTEVDTLAEQIYQEIDKVQ